MSMRIRNKWFAQWALIPTLSLAVPLAVEAQSDALIVGNGWLDMYNGNGTPIPLPTPSGSGNYAGQTATRSQVARSDGNGNLLFFGIDGNIYDGEGYLIADAQGAGCSECIYPGTMEMLAVPVPGSCFLYYLITMNADMDSYDDQPHIQVSFLDMTATNPHHPTRLGKVLYFETVAQQYPQFEDFIASLWGMGSYSVSGQLLLPGTYVKSTAPRLRIIDPVGNGSQYFLFGALAGQVVTFRIDANGLHPTNTSFGGRVLTEGDITPIPADSYSRDADVTMAPDGSIMLALTCKAGDVWIPGTENFSNVDPVQALVMYFNAVNGALIDIVGIPLDGTNGSPNFSSNTGLTIPYPPNTVMLGAKGCVIVNGGTHLMISGEQQSGTIFPSIVLWEIATGDWVDLGDQFGITGLGSLRGRLYRATYPGGQTPSVLMAGPDGCAAFIGTDNVSTMTYAVQLDLGDSYEPPQYFPAVDATTHVETAPLFLNTQITNDNYAAGFSNSIGAACCMPYSRTRSVNGYIVTSNANWTPSNNPFGTSNEVRFSGDVIVNSGNTLNITNMTLHFDEDARFIIQRGARVNAAYSTFTSYACEGERWPGIRVHGNTINPYQGNNPALPQDQEQGALYLQNCTVENADIGVWCARGDANGNVDPLYFGGYVRAYHTGFHNCQNGVVVQNYKRFDANNPNVGPELANRSYFAGCKFTVDQQWPGGEAGYQAFASNVRHLQFLQCNFENSAPELFPPDETGTGLFLFNSTAYVDGSGIPDQSYIKGFYMGVFNANGPANSTRVAKMHFDNNVYGIADLQSTLVEYGENTFMVRDQDVNPHPRVGMLLWETKKYTIEENRFEGETRESSVGIFFVGVRPDAKGYPPAEFAYDDERIYNNTFGKLQAGTLVSGLHRGDASTSVDYGLQLLCGDYTSNLLDIALLDRSIIRPNQGTPGANPSENQLAGNQFFTGDCQQSYDWTFDADWNDVATYTGMLINYKRHEQPDPIVGVDCALIDDLNDFTVQMSGLFSKEDHCANPKYPIKQSELGLHQNAYLQAKDLWKAATNTYQGTVDLGDTPDLKQAMLQTNPLLSSSYLRDLLLTKHPLSDDILIYMLEREVPLDQWHLAQVLLQNSRLSPGIWRTVQEKELLSPLLLAMVAQAQNESGGPTTKELLEQEIAQRRLTMTEHLNVLGHIYARDTTGTPTDSLKKLMLHEGDKENRLLRFETLMKLGRHTEAQAVLNGELQGYLGREVLEDLLAMQQATAGDWKLLTEADKSTLWAHAEAGRTGAAQAAAILLSLNAGAPLPPVRFPDKTKSRHVTRSIKTVAPMEPTLACYPNPSNANTYLTYPAELDGSNVVILDAKGSLVRTINLKSEGLLEVDTKALPEGMYQIAVSGTAFSTKLSVQH